MTHLDHQLAIIRQREIADRAEQRRRIGEIPTQRRTGRIRSLRRSDGTLWVFHLPRRVTT